MLLLPRYSILILDCRGKPSPRVTDASSVMDTKKIMEQVGRLNELIYNEFTRKPTDSHISQIVVRLV